ncbi:diguanylate cyclase domain-containing protein [Acidobacteriota bacterium]
MALFSKEKLQKMQAGEKTVMKHTIMLVDDVAGNLKSMAAMLLDKYDLKLAHDGQEALELLQAMKNPEDVSLIISDQRMPGLTGIQLFERLIPIMPNTIRIIITAYHDISAILDAIDKAKIYKFILKPIEPNELLLTVQRAIEAFELQRDLERYHQNLEHEVEESKKELVQRTRELELKNNQIQDTYKKLEEVRLTDPLTGLRNRYYLKKFITIDIKKVQKDYENWVQDRKKPLPSMSDLVFLILDLDRFKSINDNYGSMAGDRVLKQLVDILHRECRESNFLVRWGDEEFLIVHHSIDRDQVKLLAERLRQSIEECLFILGDEKTSHLTCSIGFAFYPFLPNHYEVIDWEQVVNIANQALYAAKKSGGNAWVGVLGTDKTKPKNLYKRMLKDINHLLANGELTILTSIQKETTLLLR